MSEEVKNQEAFQKEAYNSWKKFFLVGTIDYGVRKEVPFDSVIAETKNA